MIDKDKYITYCGMDVSQYLDENCEYNVGDGGECPFMAFPCLALNPRYNVVVAKFNVTSVGPYARIYNVPTAFTEIIVDGEVQPTVDTAYAFTTTGEHTVEYKLQDETTIVGSAFQNCAMTSITIPNSVSVVGSNAFANTNISNITLPTGNTLTLYGSAFANCKLSSLVVNNNIVFADSNSDQFVNNPIKTLVWNTNGVYNNWPILAYVDNGQLETLVYGDDVTDIKPQSVASSPKLKNVTIGSGVTSIGNQAFVACTGLTDITIPDNVTTIGNQAFSNCTSLSSLTFGNGVTTIGVSAFTSCSKIIELTIPDSVTTIDASAFANCSISALTIPDSVTSIGSAAFYGNYFLEELNYNARVPLSSSFMTNGEFKTVVIGDDVPSIADSVFNRCVSLTSVTIGNSVTIIGSYAFLQCRLNGYLNIPNSVTYIGSNAFNGCAYLTDIIIGTGITSIDGMAFNNCGGLTEITINAATPPTLGNYVFANTNECPIYVPAESVNAYKTASGWSEYADRIHSI